MVKTRDHFNKIRDTRGTFHAKMGSIKDRNGMDLTKEKINIMIFFVVVAIFMPCEEQCKEWGMMSLGFKDDSGHKCCF